MLTIALPKGRLADQTLDLMEKAGYDVSAARDKSRKLILEDKEAGLRFILSKPSDVPTYVEYGAADIGVVGKDTLLEEGRQLYEYHIPIYDYYEYLLYIIYLMSLLHSPLASSFHIIHNQVC